MHLFADKAIYAIAITRRRSLLDEDRKADRRLAECLRSEVPVPCAVVILGKRSVLLGRRIAKVCAEPVFVVRD